jgi:hypothetical protein
VVGRLSVSRLFQQMIEKSLVWSKRLSLEGSDFGARSKFSSSKKPLCTLPNIAGAVPLRRDLVLKMINLDQGHSEEVLRIMGGRLFQLQTQEV